MIDIEHLVIPLAIVISTIWGAAWKLSRCINDIKSSVVRIEAMLAANSARLDRVEQDIKHIDNRLRDIEKDTK